MASTDGLLTLASIRAADPELARLLLRYRGAPVLADMPAGGRARSGPPWQRGVS